MEINYQEIYLQMIEDCKMNIDFMDIDTYSLSQLTELINEYTETYKKYKNKDANAYNELKNEFGEHCPYIWKPKTSFIEMTKPNVDLWNIYKRRLFSNYNKTKTLRDKKQLTKRKQDIRNYNNEKKVCDICQGKYFVKNKARHCKTKKHIDFAKMIEID